MATNKFVPSSLTLLGIIAAGRAPARALEVNVLVDEKTAETAGIAGFSSPGSRVDLRRPGNGALLYGIGGGERGNSPCYIETVWSQQNEAAHELFSTKFWVPPCSNEHHSYEQTTLRSLSPAFGIAEVEVCTNNDDKQRLKGARIMLMRDITETGNHDMPVVSTNGTLLRPNCDTWNHPSRCATNKVAIGINIHHGSEGVTGLQLICATARQEEVPRPIVPEFSLDSSKAVVTQGSRMRNHGLSGTRDFKT